MIWDDQKIVAADLETSGKLPEYALQPWRLKRGDAWITSGSMMRVDPVRGFVPVLSQLFPTKEQVRLMLQTAIDNDWWVLGWNITFDVSMLMALGPDIEALCFKVKWLDGMLMERHYDIEPEYEFQTAKHKKKSYALKTNPARPEVGSAMARWLPHVPPYNEDVSFHATDPASLAKLQHYNDDDNVHTFVIAKMIWSKLTPQQRRAVLIQAETIPVVAQGNLDGLVVDQLTVRHLCAKLDTDAATYLHQLAPDGVTEKIIRSPAQLATLLFDDWKLPVLKENKSKVEGKPNSRSTDKEVLHELAFIDQRAKQIKQYRETLNARGKFGESVLASVAYNEDGRTHPVARLFGTYCVPGDVEVLTRQGWVALRDWNGGEIAQVHTDQRIEFLPATRFVGPVTDEWVTVEHARLRCEFTPGHKVPYLDRSGAWKQMHAGEWTSGMTRDLPVAGRAELSGTLTPDQMRFLVAVQADGYFNGRGGLTFCFEKQRKADRMRSLLTSLHITHREQGGHAAHPDRVEIHIHRRAMPDWVEGRKRFGPWLLDTTQEGLIAAVDELAHWDGSPHPDGGFRYVSKIRSNVEWAVTIAALAGRKAAMHDEYADGMSGCHISEQRAVVTVRGDRHVTRTSYEQRAYCATTQTGFWLARSKGHIFVTGNTDRMTVASKQGKGKDERPIGFALHQMKREAEFREFITVLDGYDLVEFDAAGQEFRWMAIASGDQTMLNLCLPGEDAHTFMGAQIVGMPYQTLLGLVKAKDKTAGDNRYLGKFANLSLQYRTSARKLRSKARVDYNIPIEMPEAHRIHATYQRAYPGVPAYWASQIAKVKGLGYVETFGGNRIKVVGDWDGGWGWSMGSTAINARIQGTGADQKHLGIACLKPLLVEVGGRFMFDLHDGAYFAIPSRKSLDFLHRAKHILDNLPYKEAWGFTPPIPMPWDAKIGKAWGRLNEVQFDEK